MLHRIHHRQLVHSLSHQNSANAETVNRITRYQISGWADLQSPVFGVGHEP